MIVSKPQTGTVISFALFLVITATVVVMNAIVILREREAAWYNYAVIAVLVPLGIVVFYKIFVRYKILSFGNNQIQIDYPMMRQRKIYPLGQIDHWIENKVKTGKNSEYNELEVKFADGKKINVGHKEHTEYRRMVEYLAQKASKKKASIS